MAEEASSRRLRRGLLGACAALVAGGTIAFWLAPRPAALAPVGADATLRDVSVYRIERSSFTSRVEISGVLEARRNVKLFSETRGPAIEVGAEALDRVETGQVLVRVDPVLAEVALERADAVVTRARSQLALARSNLKRRASLQKRNVASDADLEDAQNEEKVASAALREARAELKRATDDVTNKTISAPFAGVLRSFTVEEGEYIEVGQMLGELLDLQTARATIGLADREVVAIRAGQPVSLVVDAYPGEVHEGEVLRVGAATDAISKKFPVEVEVPNADGRLLPGMVATVVLELDDERPRSLIPRDATVDEFGLRFAWVIERESPGAGHVARRRRVEVRPVPFRPADFEVVSGLSPGEEIAVSAVRQLRDGERVRLRGNGRPPP